MQVSWSVASSSRAISMLRGRLLLLILDLLDIVLRYLRICVHQPVENIIAQISLNGDLLTALRCFRHTRASRKLLAHLLADLFQIQPMLLKSLHSRDVFPLVALDAVNRDLGVCETFRLLGLCGFGFGRLLLCVALCALLGVNGECAEVGGYRIGVVEAGVEIGMVL